jgi:hypothetical protein
MELMGTKVVLNFRKYYEPKLILNFLCEVVLNFGEYYEPKLSWNSGYKLS